MISSVWWSILKTLVPLSTLHLSLHRIILFKNKTFWLHTNQKWEQIFKIFTSKLFMRYCCILNKDFFIDSIDTGHYPSLKDCCWTSVQFVSKLRNLKKSFSNYFVLTIIKVMPKCYKLEIPVDVWCLCVCLIDFVLFVRSFCVTGNVW